MASRALAALLAMVQRRVFTHLFPFLFLALGFIIIVLGYLKVYFVDTRAQSYIEKAIVRIKTRTADPDLSRPRSLQSTREDPSSELYLPQLQF